MLETRLREYLQSQYESAPLPENRLSESMLGGRRRHIRKRTLRAVVGGAAVVLMLLGSVSVLTFAPSVAASPLTGVELRVINQTPLILQGELGPEPEIPPPGTDLSFVPVEEPTADDLAAINAVLADGGYSDPVVVSLGRIEQFDTNVYVIHYIDPGTGIGLSSVVAVGPGYPNFVPSSGPTELAWWSLASGLGPDGDGWVTMRIPENSSWGYMRIDMNDMTAWQRPSDGFFWLPVQAEAGKTVRVTGRHLTTGEVHFERTLDPFDVDGPLDALREELDVFVSKVADIEKRIALLESSMSIARAEKERLIEDESQKLRHLRNQIDVIRARIDHLVTQQGS